MADLHSVNYRLFDHLPKETYQNPFEETIIKLLHLIDWGEIVIAPVERDLMFFIETDFKRFLSSYLLHRANTIIHPEIFEFYFPVMVTVRSKLCKKVWIIFTAGVIIETQVQATFAVVLITSIRGGHYGFN